MPSRQKVSREEFIDCPDLYDYLEVGERNRHTMMKLGGQVWYALQGQFARALAARESTAVAGVDLEFWCQFRLGMYRTVADASQIHMGPLGRFACAVSLAACGRFEDAEKHARLFLLNPFTRPWHAALADALAPFLPLVALDLCRSSCSRPALRVALLLRNDHVEEARVLLNKSFTRGWQLRYPELHLLRSNTHVREPQERLADLNAFLMAKGVPVVALRNASQPPSASNIVAVQAMAEAHGPLVSVLMTTYNTGHRADVAIRSVLEQSYRDIELIVVDDSSSDDTCDVVRAWTLRDSRVKLIRLDRNGGTYVAKNIGLRYARGEFVTCHDSDDWSHPTKIERQVRPLLDDPQLVATTSLWVRIQDDGIYYARPVHPLMRINPSSPLFRRTLVMERMGIWDCVRTGADSEFLARLKLVFGRRAIKRIAQPLALGAHRTDSLMTAPATGYDASGLSPLRLTYWEAWSSWHIDCLTQGVLPRMPSDISGFLSNRPFSLPEGVMLTSKDIHAFMGSVST